MALKQELITLVVYFTKRANKYKTNFIPVDSEHFSMWYALKILKKKNIENIYLTASGGPLLKTNIKTFKNICFKGSKHPN